MFNFDYSYLNLPNTFYSFTKPSLLANPELFILNKRLCNEFMLSINSKEDLIKVLLNKNNHIKSYSQSYAGHQFGHFTKLGDGRALMIGEFLNNNKQRFDLQLKGSGQTPYSRSGDGKATLKSMLKEYLYSEAINYLNIETSRSLGLIKTGEFINRNNPQQGGILIRTMKSHIRIGTFEYASYLCSEKDLTQLTNYTINRLYPEIKKLKNPALGLLDKVMKNQINSVVKWMQVGFIHGVMNTDNTSISGESFDYGPCAFMNTYHPDTSYSSIDQNKRYSYGNQAKIIKWNIIRFAEALLPIIHEEKEKAIQLVLETINQFDDLWNKKYYGMMLKKIGINNNDIKSYPLVDELLECMKIQKMDYTNTFWTLSQNNLSENKLTNNLNFNNWSKKWESYINTNSNIKNAKDSMKKYNPVVILRNNLVEEAIEDSINGDLNSLYKLLNVISKPYQIREKRDKYTKQPSDHFESNFQTFCGT